MKKVACTLCSLVFALFLSLQMGFSSLALTLAFVPVSAADGDTTDVIINITRENEYQYAVDILFKNISFIYQLESIAVNSKTGERYVNSGKWLEQGGAPAPSFDVVVVNRSDTPICSETSFLAADFHQCGAGITVKTDGESILPAVLLEDEKKIVYEQKTSAVFGLYPDLSSYKGAKNISATVKIDRAAGTTTEGYPFGWRKQ